MCGCDYKNALYFHSFHSCNECAVNCTIALLRVSYGVIEHYSIKRDARSFRFYKEWSFMMSLKDFSFFLVIFHCPEKHKKTKTLVKKLNEIVNC